MIMKNSTCINLFTSALAALAKSKGYTIATLFLIAVVSSASAQNGSYILNNSNDPAGITAETNASTALTYEITPFATKERNSKQQYLYKKGEFYTAINQAIAYPLPGDPSPPPDTPTILEIKSMSFNVTQMSDPNVWGPNTIFNYRIRIGNYEGEELGVNNEEFTPFGAQWTTNLPAAVTGHFEMDIPAITITELGWKEIELIDKNTGLGFQWNRSKNIIVEISIETPAGQANTLLQQHRRNVLVSGTVWNGTGDRRTVAGTTTNRLNLTGGSGHDYVQGPPATTITSTNVAKVVSSGTRRFRPDIRFKLACIETLTTGAYAVITSTVIPPDDGCTRQTISIMGGNRGFGVSFLWQRSPVFDFATGTVEDLPNSNTEDYVATQTNVDMFYRRITYCSGNTRISEPVQVDAAPQNSYTTLGGWTAGEPDELTNRLLYIENGSPILSQNAKACACVVGVGANITVNDGVTLRVGTNLTVNGTMILKSGASLLQSSPAATNFGNIRVERTTTPMVVYDYTYYGSPVQDETLGGFSPATLADKYYKWNPAGQNWALVPPSSVMTPGQGYIIRAPQGWTSTPAAYTGHFVGKPNNGNITTSIMTGATSMNMVVNPYPSPLNLDAFQTENSTKLDGTYYFWTHKTPINATTHQYAANDFALYNSTGGTQAVPGGIVPTGKVAVGQGFMVKGIGATVTADVVQYKNSMRLPATTQAHFYKASGTTSVDVNATEKNRLWLNFSGSTAFKQILVGYVNGATEAYDNGFDGEISADAAVSFYSILGTKQLGIQGKGLPFNVSDVVPIGFKVSSAGTYKIELNNFDGVFAAQNVYLVDKVANITHDLKNGAYEFITTPGTHDERFEITYVSLSLQLGVASNGSTENATDFVAYKQENNLVVNAGSAQIDMVRVYDVSGRMLAEEKGLNAYDVLISNPNWASQVLIVQMHTVDKVVLTKKVVF